MRKKSVAVVVALISLSVATAAPAAFRPEPRRIPAGAPSTPIGTAVGRISPQLGSVAMDLMPLRRIDAAEMDLRVAVQDATFGFSPLLVDVTVDGERLAQAQIRPRTSMILGGRVKSDAALHRVVVRAFRQPLDQPRQLVAERIFFVSFSDPR